MKTNMIFVAAAVVATICGVLLGIELEYPNDFVLTNRHLPDAGVAIANHLERVAVRSSDSTGMTIWFNANSVDANRLLKEFANAKRCRLTLVLRDGVGALAKNDAKFSISLNAMRSSDHPLPSEDAKTTDWVVTVTIYTGERIDPYELEVPLAYSLTVGGPNAELVRLHQRRQVAPDTDVLSPTKLKSPRFTDK